jgi:hypothetical protein
MSDMGLRSLSGGYAVSGMNGELQFAIEHYSNLVVPFALGSGRPSRIA